MYVNLAVVFGCAAPASISPVELPSAWNQRYVQGASGQVPVDANCTAWPHTAGFGVTLKFAAGGPGVGVGGGRVAGQPFAPTGVPAGVRGHWSELSGTPSPSPSGGAWSA